MLSALGSILLIAAGAVLSPLLILPFHPEDFRYILDFIIPGFLLVGTGLLMIYMGSRNKHTSSVDEQDGSIVVTLGWLIVTTVSVWPFMRISGLDFSQAFFETMSGWTTTGLSMIDVENSPRILLLFRSIMQLVGGAGLAIIMMAAFSMSVGAGLYRAEGRNYQLVPNVTRSAKVVVSLYIGYAVIGIVALDLAGMSLFDAINHTFSAVSTGGFSTRPDSIGYWDSPVIEAIILILMILGNLNFLTAYVLLTGRIRSFLRNMEVKLLSILTLGGIASLFFFITRGSYGGLGKEVRVAVFEAITALTTTGYSTVGYSAWDAKGIYVIVLLMLIGGGICSTAGGLKQYRVAVLAKAIFWELQRMMLPKRAIVTHRAMVGDEESIVTERQIMEIGVYVFLYLVTLALGTGLLSVCGYSLSDSLFEFCSALGTVGLSLGLTSISTPPLALWTMSAGMLLGRLEFFVIFISLARLFRKR